MGNLFRERLYKKQVRKKREYNSQNSSLEFSGYKKSKKWLSSETPAINNDRGIVKIITSWCQFSDQYFDESINLDQIYAVFVLILKPFTPDTLAKNLREVFA